MSNRSHDPSAAVHTSHVQHKNHKFVTLCHCKSSMVSSFDTVDSRRKYDPTYHLRLTDIITLPTRPNLVGRGTEAAL